MNKVERKGGFIYGDEPDACVPVTWELTSGKELTNQGRWRADILIDVTNNPNRWEIDAEILEAMRQKYIFKLKTEDGMIFPCGIYSLEDFSEYGVGLYPLEICNVNQSKFYLM